MYRLLLRYGFDQLRSTQVAVVHCSAQTNATHLLQKLSQTCMVLSTNTGRVYRPKDCERLVLYLKDLNLPKPDKWGTSQIIAFLQQVLLTCTAYNITCIHVHYTNIHMYVHTYIHTVCIQFFVICTYTIILLLIHIL